MGDEFFTVANGYGDLTKVKTSELLMHIVGNLIVADEGAKRGMGFDKETFDKDMTVLMNEIDSRFPVPSEKPELSQEVKDSLALRVIFVNQFINEYQKAWDSCDMRELASLVVGLKGLPDGIIQ